MAKEEPQKQNAQVASVISIPGYKITDILGRGGMAIVYKATQESVGRTVALKILSPNHSDETFTERFLREAKIISNLTHPNIITVFDAGVYHSYHYMSMEYISGKTLRDARDDIPRTQKVAILKQIALALDYAGKKGYVHRDIKPDNIMLHEDGRAVLMDFGIARGDSTTSGLTITGKAIGTPYYMSPEQTKGINVDSRSDIYSLGVVLFQVLTGHVPYDGNSFVDVGMKHITEPIPTLPAGLEAFQAIINKSMSKDPAHRYQIAAEFIAALNTIPISILDAVDAKSAVINNKPKDYNSATVVESTVKPQVMKKIASNAKSRLKDNVKPGLKIKGRSQYQKKNSTLNIDISNTDEFKSLARRRRLLYLLLLVSLAAGIYFNEKQLEPYWQQYALPVLHEYLPEDIKQKIGLEKLALKENKKTAKLSVTKKQKNTVINAPIRLINIEDFVSNQEDNAISDKNYVTTISAFDVIALLDTINEQPENATKLISYYKFLLKNDINNSEARTGITILRSWFLKQFKASMENNDIVKSKLLLKMLKTNFPNVSKKARFQQMENSVLQKESIKTHLRLAEEYYTKKQFIEPESENTLEELEAVLAIEADNEAALSLQIKILDIFVSQVKKYQNLKQYDAAIISAESGLKISSNDAFLRSARKNLKVLLKSQLQVDDYINAAKIQMAKGSYVTPANNSAFKLYNKVFELDENNNDALSALNEIESKLVSQALQAIKSKNISNAKLILQLLEQYYPDSKNIGKTQTSLAEAIDSKDPTITRIVFSDILMSSMDKMEDIRIQSGNVIYFGFTFKNFSKETNYLLVNLLDHSAVTKLMHKTIKLDGTKGEQIFSLKIPGKGLVPSNYYIELKYGKKSLIKKSFQIFVP